MLKPLAQEISYMTREYNGLPPQDNQETGRVNECVFSIKAQSTREPWETGLRPCTIDKVGLIIRRHHSRTLAAHPLGIGDHYFELTLIRVMSSVLMTTKGMCRSL